MSPTPPAPWHQPDAAPVAAGQAMAARGAGSTGDPVNPVVAIFLYEGFRDWVAAHDQVAGRLPADQPGGRAAAVDQLARVEAQIGGAIEAAHLMAHYAPVVDATMVAELAADPGGRDRPGVAEYEVVNPVGEWIAGYIGLGHGQPPTEHVVLVTRSLTRGFLDRTTPTSGADAADLRTNPAAVAGPALRARPAPAGAPQPAAPAARHPAGRRSRA